jgi:hypothetical protein
MVLVEEEEKRKDKILQKERKERECGRTGLIHSKCLINI